MSFLARGIYPAMEVLGTWTTLAEARAWAGLSAEHWTAIKRALGNAETDNPISIAATPPNLFVDAIGTWATAATPTNFEKVQAALTYNALRIKYGMELVDVLPAPGPVAPPGGGAGVAVAAAALPAAAPAAAVGAAIATGLKVKLSHTVDQASDQAGPRPDGAQGCTGALQRIVRRRTVARGRGDGLAS